MKECEDLVSDGELLEKSCFAVAVVAIGVGVAGAADDDVIEQLKTHELGGFV